MDATVQLNVKAIGLDLGHTLMQYTGVPMNWQSHYPEAMAAVFARLGLANGESCMQEACLRLANYNTRLYPREKEYDARLIFTDVLSCTGRVGKEDVEAAIDSFFGYFRQNYAVYEDALPFLARLKAAGIRCGILTDVPYGMPHSWVELDTAPFLVSVDIVLSSVDVGFRKPAAEGYLLLADRLGAAACTMAYLGDEEKDVAGAKSAGMAAILIDREGGKPFYGEDMRISSLADLQFGA
jgi:putative hydrolase of the HAD superfamily